MHLKSVQNVRGRGAALKAYFVYGKTLQRSPSCILYLFRRMFSYARRPIGLVIGLLVLGAGIYYLAKEKHDPESKKIYTVVSVIGGVVAIVCAVLLAVA